VSAPIATSTELGVFLGIDSIDSARGDLMLQLAQDRLEMYVSPVPAAAKGIELAVASRAYNNVTSAHQMGLGSAQVSYGAQNSTMGVGGLYVSKSEVRDLRRLAGRTGAFSIDLLTVSPPTAAPVISNIDPDGAVAGDLVRLTGYNLDGTLTVTVGGTSAEFLEVDDTILHVVIPTGTAGDVSVVATNAIGASAAFTYTRG
jgi:hypothetical protein